MNYRKTLAKALAITTLIASVFIGGLPTFAAETVSQDFLPGRVIVVYNDNNLATEICSEDLNSLGVKSRKELTKAFKNKSNSITSSDNRKIKKMELLTIQDNSKEGVLKAIDKIEKLPGVAYAEPDYLLQITDTYPNDPSFDELYGMEKIGAPQAWDEGTGSSSVIVGVIDTGIDYNHPDLIDNMWNNPGEIAGDNIDNDNNGYIDDVYGWDFNNDDNNPMDDNGHGTHVAGTIAAVGNNEIGVVGVSWRSKVAALKYLGANGTGLTANAIEALNYANVMGFKITNNSWGGGSYSQALKDTIAAGRLFVAAAGNNGSDNDTTPHYPASYDLDNILAVANTDEDDLLWNTSNYGETTVDLAAPGTSIYSTIPGGGYGFKTGTSMATPHVAGAAALLLSKFPSMATKQLVSIIEKSVDTLPALQGLVKTGGRLNINKMMDNVRFVRFYSDNYYYGAFSDGLLEGDYTMTDLENLGCENDAARSVIIPEDYTVQIFEDDNFGGTYWLLNQNSLDSAEFSYIGADYTVSSVKIRNGVTFYQNSSYSGTSTNGLHEGNYTLAQLQSYGFVDNWASSVSIPKGYTVQIFENNNFGGESWLFNQMDSYSRDFTTISLNDTISSARIRKGVTFYQNILYDGACTNGLPEGNYTLAQLQSYGFVDNWASSVSIPEGYTVELYENDNFSGTCWTLNQNDENSMNFLNIGCNDAISSVKVIRNY